MPTLDRSGDVFVLDLGDTENRFHPDWLTSVHAALDEVERAERAHGGGLPDVLPGRPRAAAAGAARPR